MSAEESKKEIKNKTEDQKTKIHTPDQTENKEKAPKEKVPKTGKKVVTKSKKQLKAKEKVAQSKKAKMKAKKTEKTKEEPEEESEEEIEIVDEELEDEEEEEYLVKQKPELSTDLKKKLKARKMAKRKKPKFRRHEWFRYKRLGESWRRPRGLHSKLRKNRKYRINRVRVGYKTAAEVRGLHSSGFKEILVYNKNDLDNLDPKLEAARIGHSVGTKKRIEIEEYADELGIRVLNRG